MPDIYTGGPGDDYIIRDEFWFPGDGISSYFGGAGVDTIDFSGASEGWIYFEPIWNWVQDPTIPLGYMEEFGQEVFAFASLVSIEVVIAGSGNDTMYISDLTATLDGGLGDDVFLFAEGNFDDGDVFIGNLGHDILDFRNQTDALRGFVFDQLHGTILNYLGHEATMSGFEDIFGGYGNDTFIPGLGPNLLSGGYGHDVFDVSSGIFSSGATYLGGGGIDTLRFTEFQEDGFTVDLTANIMSLISSVVTPFVHLGDIEIVLAGNGDDTLIGSAGRNELRGGGGDDMIFGAGGRDVLIGEQGHDEILGGSGRDTIKGGQGDDTLDGDAHDDVIFGNAGDDTLRGGRGDDTLNGNGGADILSGDRGNDVLTGGLGSDTYVFEGLFGADVITDFDALNNDEEIDLSGVEWIIGMADLLGNHMTQSGSDVIIDDAHGNTILLLDVTLGDLTLADFIF